MPAEPNLAAQVEQTLSSYADPETGRPLGEMGQLLQHRIEGDRVSAKIGLTSHSAVLWPETKQLLTEKLEGLAGVSGAEIEVVEHERPPAKLGEIGLTAKSVIAVGSGKGGVGKSTIAASLALGLQRAGSKVGLMDADVYGPSIPHLLGVNEYPEAPNKRLIPIDANGLKVMSMGFLVPPDRAVIWRGPMLHGAVTQFLRDTEWGALDYLIIDMPPGTGDIALTLSQLLPLTGAVVVCTPQDVALLDATKAVAMFRQVKIPVLGVVENMSYFECPDTGKQYEIFGRGGARERAADLEVPFLGEVPINIGIRERGDAGETAGNYLDASSAHFFQGICERLVRDLARANAQAPPLPSLPVL